MLCGGGTIPNSNLSACDTCDHGQYSSAGDTTCSTCLKGTYSGTGASSCSVCATGKIADRGSGVCSTCPAGTMSSDDKAACVECSGGTFSGEGESSCSLCPSGKVSGIRSSTCIECPGGSKSSDDKVVCVDCSGGTYSEPGSSSCTLCDGGTYCPPKSDTMEKCPPGKYAGSGSVVCSPCEGETSFNDKAGMSSCKECPVNQQGSSDRTSCRCKSGFASVLTSEGVLDCQCNLGYTYEAGKCTVCPPGTYKEVIGNGACTSCDKAAVRGSFSTTSSILSATADDPATVRPPTSAFNCTCEKGDFLLDGHPPAEPDFVGHGYCSRCPEGANCVERGITLQNLPLKPAYWRSSQDSYKVELCYSPEACPQTNSTGNASTAMQCAEGHEGPICNICRPGYSKSVEGLCEACDKTFVIPIESMVLMVSMLLVFVMIAYFLRRRNLKKLAKRKVKRDERSSMNQIRTKSKILTSFYQILSGYESALQIRFPPVFEKFTRWLSSVANLDALQLVKADCLMETSFYTRLLFSTIAPLLLTLLIFLYMFMARTFTPKEKVLRRKQIRNNCIEAFLGLTYLVFASVSTTIFETFNCVQFGDDETRVKIDNDYDQQIFGYLLIGINLAGVGMVFATKILEPVVFVMGFFDHNHTHNARIKGLTEAHDEDTAFVAYFNDLASSLNKEAGYQDVSSEKMSEKMRTFLAENDATMELRNSYGDGAFDEGRIKFTVALPVVAVKDLILNLDCDLRHKIIEHYQLDTDAERRRTRPYSFAEKKEARLQRRVLYSARKMPFPLKRRDYMVEQFNAETLDGSGHIIVSRSIYDEELFSLTKSKRKGFVRADVLMKGYLLRPSVKTVGSTDITYIACLSYRSKLEEIMSKKGLKKGLKTVVREMRFLEEKVVKEEAPKSFSENPISNPLRKDKSTKSVARARKSALHFSTALTIVTVVALLSSQGTFAQAFEHGGSTAQLSSTATASTSGSSTTSWATLISLAKIAGIVGYFFLYVWALPCLIPMQNFATQGNIVLKEFGLLTIFWMELVIFFAVKS
ncbi:hypothetical protein TrCOL_g8292 [Triparma columacea]|uniref:Tyrosine-protein kinase ephrin type A/B receptor-like domain-containing protein n=1 Tax=Triparma columacea TaxID=722753 RepID=A0A9W7FV88_9STRA|nr:hypothetical protein TrCOL_g8292 [Triparma columacea]